ncbi:MAG TPA: hypothetical protein V6D10_25025 [Trichocoleus sp.]|jgi:hypothetical protein
MKWLIQYLNGIKLGKAVLWCYFIWYVTVVYFYFDPSLQIWINSIGVSVVIGTGLILSVSSENGSKKDYWQIFRLYLMPFCVSSFSTLIKEHGFIVFVSPRMAETTVAVLLCVLFLLVVCTIKLSNKEL